MAAWTIGIASAQPATVQAPAPIPADTRNASDINLLGCLQLQGGVQARARDYFEQVAADLPAARFNLGVMLARGAGGDAQPARGRAAIESAWNAALPEAGVWLLESAMARRELKEARAIAERLQPLEHPRGDLVVARLRFAEGRHEQGFMLASRAARAGQPQAVRLLAMLGQQGTGLPRDAMESASWQLIAEAMLSPARPTDSVFHAAVKHSMQSNDWTPAGPVPADASYACDPRRAGNPAAAGTAASGEPATLSPAAGRTDRLRAEGSGLPAATVSTATPALPVFELVAGQGLRDAWIAYGLARGTPTSWSGEDIAARSNVKVQPASVEALGLLITDSAEAIGVRLRLQLQTDAAGTVLAARLVRAP